MRCWRRREAWLRDRGCDRMVGPMDLQLNDESGVLFEGFELEPLIRQPWHPPYYQQRCEAGRADQGDGPVQLALDIGDRADRCCRSSPSSPSRHGPSTGSGSAR